MMYSVIFSFILLHLTLTVHIFTNGAYAASCFECSKDGCTADPCNSRYFYECNVSNSSKTLLKCNRGHFYQSGSNKCVCSARRKPTNRASTHPCSTPLRGRKLVADECDCSTYWICCSQEGIIKKTCSNGKVFDPSVKKCVNTPSSGTLSTCCGAISSTIKNGGQPAVTTSKVVVQPAVTTSKVVVQPALTTSKVVVQPAVTTSKVVVQPAVTTAKPNNCPCGDNVCYCPADSLCNSFYSCEKGNVLKVSCYPSSLSFDTKSFDIKPFNYSCITCIKRSTEQCDSCDAWIDSFKRP